MYQVCLDGGLERRALSKLPRRIRCVVIFAKNRSTWFNQLALVGVKWRWYRGWRTNQRVTFGTLWVP